MTSRFRPSRRAFLGGAVGGALASGSLGSLLARAGTTPGSGDLCFVFAYFSGGWDVLLSLDPRDPDVFRDDVIADTLIQPGYQTLIAPDHTKDPIDTGVNGIVLGPYAGPLVPWMAQTAIVRGMSMETLTHEVGRRRFLTGKPPSGLLARGSSISTVLAAYLAEEAPIPNLAAQVESYNVDQPSFASALRVDDVGDLVRALQPGDLERPALERERIAELLDALRDCPATLESKVRTDALDFRASARGLVDQRLDALFDFDADTAEMIEVRDRYGIVKGQLSSPQAQAAMAATALTAGVSRCVSIDVTDSLDTHYNDWQTLQGPRQETGFSAVAALADDLASKPHPAGGTWLDHTVILGFSEFCRTALLNANGGRDHSLTNACFLLGGGISGGRIVGASSDIGMTPSTVDLATGLVDPAGEVILPEHVLRTLLVRAGVVDDVADLRVEPIAALLG